MAEEIPEGDYERGKKVFKMRCLMCHVVNSDVQKTGPPLRNIFGRKAGTVVGYDYSAANKLAVMLKLHSFLGLQIVKLLICV
ncbi:unnamed protein product [Anisakis simplex]|uniref:Cytochrome c (inferred by orthology to a human protein) n=1 Tax=Anisakis simplex TaxID=6269 RepID=A0A0M3KH46_ANISI|nr:unnamed protein product [Anisakis simplex]